MERIRYKKERRGKEEGKRNGEEKREGEEKIGKERRGREMKRGESGCKSVQIKEGKEGLFGKGRDEGRGRQVM